MGTEYYSFKASEINDIKDGTYEKIEPDSTEYINYNRFLEREYFTNIEDNCDFIPLNEKGKVKMILRKDQFEITEIEDVFEILFDSLYMGEVKEYEENTNC